MRARTYFILSLFLFLGLFAEAQASLKEELLQLKPSRRICVNTLALLGKMADLTVEKPGASAFPEQDMRKVLAKSGALIRDSRSLLLLLRPDLRAEMAAKWLLAFKSAPVATDPKLKVVAVDVDRLFSGHREMIAEHLRLILAQERGDVPFRLSDEETRTALEAWRDPHLRDERILEFLRDYAEEKAAWSLSFLNNLETRDTRSFHQYVLEATRRWLMSFDPITFFEKVANSSSMKDAYLTFLEKNISKEEFDAFRFSLENCAEVCPYKDAVDNAAYGGIFLHSLIENILLQPSTLWVRFPGKGERWMLALPDYQLELRLKDENGVREIESVALHVFSESTLLGRLPKDPVLVELKEEQKREAKRSKPPAEVVTTEPPAPVVALVPRLEHLALHPDFRQFLLAAAQEFPTQVPLLELAANSVVGLEALQIRFDIRDGIRQALEFDLGEDFLNAMLWSCLEKHYHGIDSALDQNQNSQPAIEAGPPKTKNLSDLVLDRRFRLDWLKPEEVYNFRFNNDRIDFHFRVTEEALEFAARYHGKRWFLKFLKGAVSAEGEQGLKKLRGDHLDGFEIKLKSHGHQRIAVRFEPETKTWIFVRGFE